MSNATLTTLSTAVSGPPEESDIARNFGEKVLVRPYPKIIVLYPTMFAAFLCALLSWCLDGRPEAQEHIATLFLSLFALNAVILSFEFPRLTFICTLLSVAVVLLIMGIWHLYEWLFIVSSAIHWSANTHFYMCVGLTLLAIYVVVWIGTRFDYWEITPNDVTHHHGPWAGSERYAAPNLRVSSEIPDIWEYIMLRGGRLVLRRSQDHEPIVIEIVIRARTMEARIQHLLKAMEVRIEPEHSHDKV